MNIALVGNPVAGRGKATQRIERLVEVLERWGHHVDSFLTRVAGDARDWSGRIGPATEDIVVAGGDETLNEVLNGLADPSETPIALLPLGTANVLARELKLPVDPEGVVHMLDRGYVRKLDMGLVRKRRFLLMVSVGTDAMVVEEVRRSRTGALGFRGYVLSLLRCLARYRIPELTVQVDGRDFGHGAFVVVSKVRNYGGIFKITDKASGDFGHLDVVVFLRGTLPALFSYGLSALRGKISSRGDVSYATGNRVRVDSHEAVAVQVDGDYLGTTPIEIEFKPSSVPILVPGAGGEARGR